MKTPTGIVVEFQHSPINDHERIAREEFYGNLVWVLDGTVFSKNFDIFHMLPAPDSLAAQDLAWVKAKRHYHGANHGIFFRVSEAQKDDPSATKATVRSRLMHFLPEIQNELTSSYKGHHQYDWIRPRRTWLDAICPVFIDFEDQMLVRLTEYDESGLPCIQYVDKRRFLYESMCKEKAEDIGV